MREPNILLDALIDEAGMSHDGFASRVNQAGLRHGLDLFYDHASVRRWIRDATVPRGRVPELISPSQLTVGDRISVRIRARGSSSLGQVESTPANHVGEHEPASAP